MRERKNQTKMTSDDWAQFIDAVNQTHGVQADPPAYRDFVAVHARAMNPLDSAAMNWGVHSMGSMMPGFNFLSWHRWFVLQMENRLRRVHDGVMIPYWDAITDRYIPPALDTDALKKAWGISRQWDPSELAAPPDVAAAMNMSTFDAFQRTLEGVVHGSVHNAVGGQMATGSSPADPLFWLHHANIDRHWADWQADKRNAGKGPSNPDDVLQPPPLFGVSVSSVSTTQGLNYQYV